MNTVKVVRAVALSSVLLMTACVEARQTDVFFNFDAEDYTADSPNDAIRDLANLLTEEGVVGQFFIVGYLAQRIQEFGRADVIKALKPHVIGSQTLYHSRHPAICEYTDIADADLAYHRALREEAECVGMLKAVFGLDSVESLAPPGNSVSYAAMEAYVDLGIRFYAGGSSWGYDRDGRATATSGLASSRRGALGFWYFNMYQLPYLNSRTFYLENMLLPPAPEPDYKAILDHLAGLGYCALYMHPNQAVCQEFWDVLNYNAGRNLRPWGKWVVSPRRSAEDTATVYRRLRGLIRAIKADGRFRISNMREVAATIKPRRNLVPSDMPSVKAALDREFGPIDVPGSYSVSDVFQAAVRFLRGEAEYAPGKVYGFLSAPVGVSAPVRVDAECLRQAAKRLDLSRYLPSAIDVGGTRIGPADFLFAALEVLTTGAGEVLVSPREQLGSFSHVKRLEHHTIPPGWCIHSPDFRDEYLSDRLRYQLWTARYE